VRIEAPEWSNPFNGFDPFRVVYLTKNPKNKKDAAWLKEKGINPANLKGPIRVPSVEFKKDTKKGKRA
jgi:hypothetical protein